MIDPVEVTKLQKLIAFSSDQPAYIRLYRIYFTPLKHFVSTIVGSPQVGEEVISDVFLQIWLNRHKLDTINNFTVYLYTCARNQALNVVSRERRRATVSLDESYFRMASATPDPEQVVLNTELAGEIEKSIRRLPVRCRTIFKMVREDGMKYREVAEILGISVKTVEAQLAIAMKRISDTLADYTGTTNKRSLLKVVPLARLLLFGC